MSTALEALEARILCLSAEARSRLLDRLIASLDADRERDEAWDRVATAREAERARDRIRPEWSGARAAAFRSSVTAALHRGAQRDLEAAFQRYRKHASDRVALRFLEEVERAIELLCTNPASGTSAPSGRRVFALRTFPYWLIHRPDRSEIVVLDVRHQHRDPSFGGDRR